MRRDKPISRYGTLEYMAPARTPPAALPRPAARAPLTAPLRAVRRSQEVAALAGTRAEREAAVTSGAKPDGFYDDKVRPCT